MNKYVGNKFEEPSFAGVTTSGLNLFIILRYLYEYRDVMSS